ncbi:hypothetical protein [Thalassococcus sp. S3]|uniref:hypothetical protein n=1 Tax=Thalassococcus sp. S3 TaxID=2017482 RepID=UPI001024745E|nr:hypothetical protein [Thalassococcus sp. S3]QBF33631.1 hypothetical protein CFI11_20785 [Thalassococcus sp. S3]
MAQLVLTETSPINTSKTWPKPYGAVHQRMFSTDPEGSDNAGSRRMNSYFSVHPNRLTSHDHGVDLKNVAPEVREY